MCNVTEESMKHPNILSKGWITGELWKNGWIDNNLVSGLADDKRREVALDEEKKEASV